MMNPIFYFLLAITAVLAATANADGPVLDTDGDIIFHGSYYVLPVIRGRGGGLTLSGRGGERCPLDIVQEESEYRDGVPVKFSNWKSRVGFVPESENLNIKMDVAATTCVQSTYWWIDEFDQERRKYFVKADRKPEGFGRDSAKSYFQILKSDYIDNAYEFAYCPGTTCKYVGVFQDEENVWRLALNSKPFLVMFKKADYDVTKSLSKIAI